MHQNPTNVSNPNFDVGCHPSDLRSRIDSELFSNGLIQPSYAQSIQQPCIVAQHRLDRRKALDRLMAKVTAAGILPGLERCKQYLRIKYRRNCSVSTLQQTASSLILFLSFYHRSGKQRIDQIERQDLEAFVEHEQDRGLAPNTVRSRLCNIYAFIRFLINEKVLGYEMLERKIRIKLADPLPRAIEAEDVQRLMSVIDHVRDRAMILLLLRTGMRIGELLNTTIEDLDLNNQRIIIYRADKTSVGRVVYFSDDAFEALMAWLRVRDANKHRLFYGQGRLSLSYESARSMFVKYLKKAGLQYHGYTLHCLRHTFATELLNARMPLECLRVLLGHTNLEVTRRYARLSDKAREEEYFNAMDKVINDDFGRYDQCDG